MFKYVPRNSLILMSIISMGNPSVRMYIMPENVHNAGPRIAAVVVAAATTKTLFVDRLLLDAPRQIYNGSM